MAAALEKNQEPTKHRTLVVVGVVMSAKPGAVPTAKNDDPMMNSQHCRHS
jgi:hypothetical protein